VDYYPSYESVVLSDRKAVWEADLVHVTDEAVAMNVGRMLDRYVSGGDSLNDLRGRIETGGRLVAEELARSAATTGGDQAAEFFAEFAFWSERSSGFAFEHARFLLARGEDEAVIRVLCQAPADAEPLAIALLKAEAQLKLGRADDAVATLLPLTTDNLQSQPAWELLVRAYAKGSDPSAAIGATQRYISSMGYMRPYAFLNLARALRISHPARSTDYYESVADHFADEEWVYYEIAEFLVQQNKFDSARRVLANFRPKHADLILRAAAMRRLLDPDKAVEVPTEAPEVA
jgi:tetratricopeptide (TPR) repeat protein